MTLTAAWALTASRRDYRRTFWLLSAALLFVLIFTFSRGGLLSLAGAAGTLGLFYLGRVARRSRLGIVWGIGGLAAVAIAVLLGIVVISQSSSARAFGDATRVDMWRSQGSEMAI